MTTVMTKLVKDGNSVAVRLPKTVLVMSGLHDDVQMEVRRGQIVLRSASKPRASWKQRMEEVAAANPAATTPDAELDAWEVTNSDGLDQKR